MLKRYQVLISDWLAEYANFITEVYDCSFSEAVRILMSIGAMAAITELNPKYKPSVSIKKMLEKLKNTPPGKLKEEIYHRQLSELYHEARKATESRMSWRRKGIGNGNRRRFPK